MSVLGIGGFFFRARDPEALKNWYREHLGIGGGIGTDARGESNPWLWYPEAGPMVFEPFAADSDYFPADRTAMINLRVRDLDALLERLRAAGIAIGQQHRDTEAGDFARIHDPEGNPIELWQPPVRDAAGGQP
jgi:predicted enzyme related to lactoylglutathione lyase